MSKEKFNRTKPHVEYAKKMVLATKWQCFARHRLLVLLLAFVTSMSVAQSDWEEYMIVCASYDDVKVYTKEGAKKASKFGSEGIYATIKALVIVVNSKMNEQWQPLGAVSNIGDTNCQTMVKD